MTTKRRQNYEKRMARVLDYIERNIDASFSLDELCAVANFSKYHFHRQFSEYAGMTIFQLIVRRKMKRAAYQLLFREEVSVTEIAFDAGYESLEAFSKAFKREVGFSPSKFRKDHKQVERLDAIDHLKRKSVVSMDVKIEEFPGIRLAVLEHRGPPATVMQSVRKFIAWRKAHHLPPSKSRTFNLMYDDPGITPAEDYQMDIGAELKGVLKPNDYGVIQKTIPACECACVRHRGSWDDLGEAIRALYGGWLPDSGREPMDFPIFLERVNLYPETPEPDLITDIYLSLRLV